MARLRSYAGLTRRFPGYLSRMVLIPRSGGFLLWMNRAWTGSPFFANFSLERTSASDVDPFKGRPALAMSAGSHSDCICSFITIIGWPGCLITGMDAMGICRIARARKREILFICELDWKNAVAGTRVFGEWGAGAQFIPIPGWSEMVQPPVSVAICRWLKEPP